MNIGKNLSIQEHLLILNKRISKSSIKDKLTIEELSISNLFEYKGIFMKEINENDFLKFKDYFLLNINCLILNAYSLKNMLKKDNSVYRYSNKCFENIFNDKVVIENKFIIKDYLFIEKNTPTIIIDTLFLSINLLNKKTINSFSFIILNDKHIIYLMKRKKTHFIFIKPIIK